MQISMVSMTLTNMATGGGPDPRHRVPCAGDLGYGHQHRVGWGRTMDTDIVLSSRLGPAVTVALSGSDHSDPHHPSSSVALKYRHGLRWGP